MDTISDEDSMDNSAPLSGLDPADLLRQGAAEDTLMDEPAPSFHPPSLAEMAEWFPRFEILGLIGQGGMGAVYKIRQKDLDRVVALKILPPAIGVTPGFSERFTREAKALAKLNHPAIVTLHEFGQTPSEPPLPFILMEFVDGLNLAQLMKSGRIAPREALAIVPHICDALQYAHDHGIVHRDIKPENILLDRQGRVKVADFGIAKVIEAVTDEMLRSGDLSVPADATIVGKILGTPQYMAPEQIDRPSEVDHRADIYALGVVFYQMLTGELPDKDLQAPSKKVRIDVRLDEIVMRAMERKPERRYQQAGIFKTQLETIAETGQAAGQISTESEVFTLNVPSRWFGYEYKSKRKFCGLPLLHVTNGMDPKTGLVRHSRGIVAIGGIATGWLAMGGRAYGGIAFGGIAVGGVAIGGLAAGLASLGGMTIALIAALGGFAIAPVAIGGLAVGYLAIGGQAVGVQEIDARNYSPEVLRQLARSYQSHLFAVTGGICLLLLGLMVMISAWARKQVRLAADNGTAPATGASASGRFSLRRFLGIALILCLPLAVWIAFDQRSQQPVQFSVDYTFTIPENTSEEDAQNILTKSLGPFEGLALSKSKLPDSRQWKISSTGSSQGVAISRIRDGVKAVRHNLALTKKRALSEQMVHEEERTISSKIIPWNDDPEFLVRLRVFLVLGLICVAMGSLCLLPLRQKRSMGWIVAVLVAWSGIAAGALDQLKLYKRNEFDPWARIPVSSSGGETDVTPGNIEEIISDQEAMDSGVREWLGHIDARNLSTAWDDMSEGAKSLQNESGWEAMVKASREPLGEFVKRDLMSRKWSGNLAGFKDLSNQVFKYRTEFKHGRGFESVTLVLEENGDLRVMSYVIEVDFSSENNLRSDKSSLPGEDGGRGLVKGIVESVPVALKIMQNGEMMLNGEIHSRESLADALNQLRLKNKNLAVSIRGNGDVSYQKIVETVDLCQKLGIWNLSFGTKDEDKESAPSSLEKAFVDLDIEVAKAREMYLEGDPNRKKVEIRWDAFVAENPDFPNALSREIVTRKRLALLEEIDGLVKTLGVGHPKIVDAEREMKRLADLPEMGKKQFDTETTEKILAKDLPSGNRFQIRFVVPDEESAESMTMIYDTGSSSELHVSREVIVCDRHVSNASYRQDGDGGVINITFNEVGAQRLAEATKTDLGRMRLAIVMDGKVESAPVVQAQLGSQIALLSRKTYEEYMEFYRSLPIWNANANCLPAVNWLMEVDQGKLGESYSNASISFRGRFSEEDWKRMLRQFRSPLGIVTSRGPKLSYHETSVGSGDSEVAYRLFTIKTHFSEKSDTVEIVSMVKESDDVWKVDGYWIR